MSKGNGKGKSRDTRDRFSVTFDIGGLRDRLVAQASEPNQSLASIVRMAVSEWLADRESQNSDKRENDKIDISINDND
jgi:predicted DNA-binding ribbon-helix-helix protein